MRKSINCVPALDNKPKQINNWLVFMLVAFLSLLPLSSLQAAEPDNVIINLVDGTADNAPMLNTRIDIREVLADGTKQWRKRITTDSSGQASTYLEQAEAGTTYQLSARSTFNNRTKTILIDSVGEHTFQVGTPLLNVTLRNHHSNDVFVNTRVFAYHVQADGTYKYLANKYSDENGRLIMDLPILSQDDNKVQLRAIKPLNGIDAYSSTITRAGNFEFSVGQLQVKVLNGDNKQAIADKDVHIYTHLDGKNKWYGRAKTDAAGVLQLNLKGLSSDNPPSYLFKTRSPFNNRYKESQLISSLGNHEFLVGTPLLHITLKNSKTNAALPNIRVRAYQIQNGSNDKYLGRATSDASGQLSFDLPILSNGGSVQLRAERPLNNIDAYSDIITTPGNFKLNVGALQVSVINADSKQALANQDIHIYTQLDGKNKWYGRAKTDASGLLQLNLRGLSSNNPPSYLFKTRSPFNNKYKESQLISSVGGHEFLVGTPLLHVTLSSSKTNAALANTRVTAYQIQEGVNPKYLGRANTDINGQLSLDLPTLSNGGSVQLRAQRPLNNIDAYSNILTSPGNVQFKVGGLQVKVTDNDSKKAIANQDVYIYTQTSEGKNKWYGRAKTDASGLLQLNLKDLSSDTGTPPAYLFKTRSPFNNRYKQSQLFTQNGEYEFLVGEPLLHVTLKDASNNNSPIANAEVRAYQTVNGKRRGIGKAKTDEKGLVTFDIPDLSKDGTTVQLMTRVFNSSFWAKSQTITSTNPVNFLLASTTVKVIDGSVANGSLLPDLKVYLREVTGPDSRKYVGHVTTDSEGLLRLTLPEISSGKAYILDAKNPSPLVSRRKYSQPIGSIGEHTFVLGTQLLKVSLANAITQQPVADKRVDVYQYIEGENPKWRGRVTTDAAGLGFVDVPQLAEVGNSFYLRAVRPYGNNHAYSEDFASNTFNNSFLVGKTPVTLSNKSDGLPMSNASIHTYEILSTGKLQWRGRGTTDTTGTVHFDLRHLADGKPHVFRAINPFGNNKHHYSERVTSEGAVNFAIDIEDDGSLDLVAPSVAITSPSATSEVATSGFKLAGTASDNKQLDSVIISIDGTDYPVSVNSITSSWELMVPAEQLRAGMALKVQVTATDQSKNQSTTQASYTVIADSLAPTVNIVSPSDNGSVSKTGFLATGTAIDDTGIKTLHATLEDSSLGKVVDRDIEVSSNGNWALAVNNGQLTESGTAKLTLVATDIAGRESTVEITVAIAAADHELRHMINRITFGANEALLNEIKSIGATAYLEQQLAPQAINDEILESKLAEAGIPSSIGDLQRYQLTHMIYSKRQLREVMAWFWENHFNTFIRKTGNTVAYELAEHDAFRANALGNFRNLLEISAKSPAMLIYLDNILNVSDDANENYAREVMELSTCGVDACYSQQDVDELAEILTGWQIKDDRFFFNNDQHTTGNKFFQGELIKEGGVEEGNQALDMLARHEATANYICGKLINVFVSDAAQPELNARCASTFQVAADDDDQMSQVVRTILSSPEFNDLTNFNSKVKSPVEFSVGVARALNAQGSHGDLAGYTSRMGISLFFNPVPTGWSEIGSEWINSNLLLERTRFVNKIARASMGGQTYIDPITFFQDRNIETPEGITAYLFDLLGGDIWSDREREIALEILNDETVFDIDSARADEKLRELIGTIQSYPEYHYQ